MAYLRKPGSSFVSSVRSVLGANDLDELHDEDGVEEMQAAERGRVHIVLPL